MNDKKYRDKKWLKEQFDLYKTPTNVSNMTGYPRTCITRYATKYNLYQTKFTREKTNYVNEDYFNNIDTANKAYFLGFIMADGNIYKYKDNDRYQFSIKIKNTDKDILLKLAADLNFNPEKIKERSEERNGTITKCAEIKIYNKTLCKSLIALGVVPKKTGKEIMPKQIPQEFKKDFIRGFIDGDGWIGKDRTQIGMCSMSKTIIADINNYFIEVLNFSLNVHHRKDGITVAKIFNRKKVYHALKHFYYEGCTSLNRKNDIAKEKIKSIYDDLIGSL